MELERKPSGESWQTENWQNLKQLQDQINSMQMLLQKIKAKCRCETCPPQKLRAMLCCGTVQLVFMMQSAQHGNRCNAFSLRQSVPVCPIGRSQLALVRNSQP